ncbi:monovalent cation:proton antiporter family protein [Salinisphaera sp. SWV1]|uniref:monovalent cation:proton antiporter family protein n=1 Tax=Salinisphaera sp. SWV1 TaxID=3454139 RepID=UPI003F84A2AF
MHSNDISFVPLLVVIALSFAVPVALSPVRRLGIPVVVGEIAAGILVGDSGLHLVSQDFVLKVLSVFGFAYLMFLSGLEIDFSGLEPRRGLRASNTGARLKRNPFVIGGAAFALTALCSLAAGFYLAGIGLVAQPWLMALILSTTSLGVVAPVLKERGLLETTYGQTLLVAALIADFVTILLVSGYAMLRVGATVDLLLILVLLLAFVAAWRLAERARSHLPAQRLMHALSTATSQIRVRGSMALALVFIALAESLGIENILGAFLAGVIVSMLSGSESSVLREKLDAIGYGFFIPIFFIMVGVKFDLPALLSSESPWETIGVLVVAAFGVKLVGSLVFRLAFGWRETFAASTLLSARLSLIIAVAAIGVEIGVISPALDAAIILVAIISCLISPIAFSRLAPRRYQSAQQTLVIGDDRDSRALAARLEQMGRNVRTVTELPAGENGNPPSRARLSECLRTAGIEQAQTVIAMADTDEDNLQICRVAREVHAVRKLLAWVRDPAYNARFRSADVRIVNPAYAKLLLLESMALDAGQIDGRVHEDDSHEIRIAKLQNSWLADRELRHLNLPEGTRVLRIERRGAVLEAEPATLLRVNDTLTVVGARDDVDAVTRRLARRW